MSFAPIPIRQMGSVNTHASSGHPAIRGPTRPPPSSPFFGPSGTIGFRPGKSPWEAQCSKVRPSHFQKWVKKFSGAGDPYDHLASFKQIARAEEVYDLHTLVKGFGLTLEGKALSWFQTLDPAAFRKLQCS